VCERESATNRESEGESGGEGARLKETDRKRKREKV